MSNMATVPFRDIYGTKEVGGLVNGIAYHQDNADNTHPDHPHGVYWDTPGLEVTRLRLLSDYSVPFWDVSYCDGKLDGYYVSVQLPFSQLPKRQFLKAIVEYAKKDRVYAKKLGILDVISTLI